MDTLYPCFTLKPKPGITLPKHEFILTCVDEVRLSFVSGVNVGTDTFKSGWITLRAAMLGSVCL